MENFSEVKSLLEDIRKDVNKLHPVFDQLVKEIQEARKERRELIKITTGKGQVPLSVVIVLIVAMGGTLLLEKLQGNDFEILGSGLGVSGSISAKQRRNQILQQAIETKESDGELDKDN